ncbi:STAS domain-containing protein [Streptosporangium minutum]|uniref:Anti-sigma factor antagonist n=1 Tax=Streptosporangium minutum TaxID=569862 RepID=A0A243RWX7_9ACTN|nr:STAS domain-containing protein [Streptosporangium minutum]OUC99661.1 hypothetical protein CA984_02025 [Streptosporangium minutum]
MTALSIRLVHHSCHSVLVLGGELDGISAPLLRLPVDTVLDTGRRHLVIDTTDLTFCDSSGLRALLGAQDSLTLAGATMELSGVRGLLHRVLDLTGLARSFTTSPLP